MKRQTLVLSLALLLSSPAWAAGTKVQVGDPVQGGRLYGLHCASCHGEQATGQGALRTHPAAADLTDPARMNLLGEAELYKLLAKGGAKAGRAPLMPAFGGPLDPLELWDLVAWLRTQHLSVTDFYPNAGAYFGDVYELDQWGRERHAALTGQKLQGDALRYTVLGVYKGTPRPEGPRLIPNTPLAVSQIDRRDKVGYVVFVEAEVPGIPGKHVLGISMDKSGLVWEIRANTRDPALSERIEATYADWKGYGYKGMKEPFEGGRSKRERTIAANWTGIYSRAMEAVVMFDKAERERHWADADFGGPADDAVSVEGGQIEINEKKKR